MEGVRQVATEMSFNARHTSAVPLPMGATLSLQTRVKMGLALSPGWAGKRGPEFSPVVPKWISPYQVDHEGSRSCFLSPLPGRTTESCKL